MRTAFLLLLFALIGIGLWERRAIGSLREESAALRAEQAEAAQLAAEIAVLKQGLPANSVAAVPELDRSELLRLRNAVGRLRAAQLDLGKLRTENERLVAELKAASSPARRLADEPGFVARESWVNAGNATPEAALQSIFSALRDANMDQLIALTATAESESMRRALLENPATTRAEFTKAIREQFNPTGYLIVSRDEIPGGKIRFKVKLSASVEPMDMEFQRVGDTWVLTHELRF